MRKIYNSLIFKETKDLERVSAYDSITTSSPNLYLDVTIDNSVRVANSTFVMSDNKQIRMPLELALKVREVYKECIKWFEDRETTE